MGFDGRQPGDNPALDIIEGLRAENESLKNEMAKWVHYWRDKDNKALAEKVAKLREALGRFVANADRADSDDLADTDATYVVVAHLRHARAVLKEVGGVDE